MALLVCVGVDEEGFREALAVEVAGTEKGAAYASLLRGLIDRGLSGVRLVVSDDHEGIKAAMAGELPGAEWQRCTVHFERNVLSHVPPNSMAEVAQDLQGDLQGKEGEDGRGVGRGVRLALRGELSQGCFGVRGGNRGRSHLSSLPAKPPCPDTHDQHARAALQRGEEEDEGSGRLPERDECEHLGHRDSFEEQRGVGAQTLPYDRDSRRSRETKPTTFETLTILEMAFWMNSRCLCQATAERSSVVLLFATASR
jgi:hypothetical protein